MKFRIEKSDMGNYWLDDSVYKSPYMYLWFNYLDGCGCGSSDDLAKLCFEVLENFGKDFDDRKLKIYEDEKLELIAHWLGSKELIEHGSSISGAWLTEEGEKVLNIIKQGLEL